MIFYQNTICTGNACKSAPSTPQQHSERRTPQTLSWPHNWWSTAVGKQIENQCRWHQRNENEALGGVGRLQPSQGKQCKVRMLEHRQNLVPAVVHPPHLPSHFIYRAQIGWINSFNLELNVLTSACLPAHLAIDFRLFTSRTFSRSMQPLTPTVRRAVRGYHLGGVRVNSSGGKPSSFTQLEGCYSPSGHHFRQSNADKPVTNNCVNKAVPRNRLVHREVTKKTVGSQIWPSREAKHVSPPSCRDRLRVPQQMANRDAGSGTSDLTNTSLKTSPLPVPVRWNCNNIFSCFVSEIYSMSLFRGLFCTCLRLSDKTWCMRADPLHRHTHNVCSFTTSKIT